MYWITRYDLRLPSEEEVVFRTLKHGKPDLGFWSIEDQEIEPEDNGFDDLALPHFEKELIEMVRIGVSGYVVLARGDELIKYVLDPKRERVLVYLGECRMFFKKRPTEVLRT